VSHGLRAEIEELDTLILDVLNVREGLRLKQDAPTAIDSTTDADPPHCAAPNARHRRSYGCAGAQEVSSPGVKDGEDSVLHIVGCVDELCHLGGQRPCDDGRPHAHPIACTLRAM